MRIAACLGTVLALFAPAAGSAPARIAYPPQIVGPPALRFGACAVTVTTPGGTSAGAAIPIPALRLGAPVARNAASFQTGGGGTANAYERQRRLKAGLQADPIAFDTTGSEKPSVFAVEPSQVPVPAIYQRLPLKPVGMVYDTNAMIFAQATSRDRGRIVSLALRLAEAPSARPKLTITGTRPMPSGCAPGNPIQVYATAMTASQLHRLFAPSGCSWNRLGECSRAQLPRGRVLFVQKQGGASYEYRWVDYDLLLGAKAVTSRG